MELQGRNLENDVTGEDVVLLHNELFKLGYKIAEDEIIKERYGDTTRNAVVDFQKKTGLVPNGICDAKSAWLLGDDHEDPYKFIVIGQVVNADGTPRVGATVKAFDKHLRSEQQLGHTDSTRNQGEYEIYYREDEFSNFEKDQADLIVRVSDASGTVLASSTPIFNAVRVETINFTIGTF